MTLPEPTSDEPVTRRAASNRDSPVATHELPGVFVTLAIFVICLMYFGFIFSGLVWFGVVGLVIVVVPFSLSRLGRVPLLWAGVIAAVMGYGFLIETFAVSNFT